MLMMSALLYLLEQAAPALYRYNLWLAWATNCLPRQVRAVADTPSGVACVYSVDDAAAHA